MSSRDTAEAYDLNTYHDLQSNENHNQNPHSRPVCLNQPSQPLIESARNGWQSRFNPSYDPLYSGTGSGYEKYPHFAQMASIVCAPRFRRGVVVSLSLLLLAWVSWSWLLYPRLQERSSLLRALDPATEEESEGWFGSNSMLGFENLIQLKTLSPELVPGALVEGQAVKAQKRLVIVGDVHGCKEELVKLLDKVSFSTADGDHLIFTGDIINKGPNSGGVVNLAREYSASCVRGNHEDRLLLLRHELEKANAMDGPRKGDSEIYSSRELKERELARSLSYEQVQWLDQCPVILKVGSIPTMGQVVVVHGGLVPGVELERQDPASVMNMRTIDVDTHVPSSERKGMNWAKMFDKYHQSVHSSNSQSQAMTVVYGHDAKTGLKIRAHTKGLDSGCVKGGKLTALVIEDGGKQSLVQVSCHAHKKK